MVSTRTSQTLWPLFGPLREPTSGVDLVVRSVMPGPPTMQVRTIAAAVASAEADVTGPAAKENSTGAGE